MANRDVVSDVNSVVVREMDDRCVLDVRSVANRDGIDVPSKDAARPYADGFAEGHIAHDNRFVGHVSGIRNARILRKVFFESFFGCHRNLERSRRRRSLRSGSKQFAGVFLKNPIQVFSLQAAVAERV